MTHDELVDTLELNTASSNCVSFLECKNGMQCRECIEKEINDYECNIRADERTKVLEEVLNLPKHEYKVYDGVDEVIRKECIYVSDIGKLKGESDET